MQSSRKETKTHLKHLGFKHCQVFAMVFYIYKNMFKNVSNCKELKNGFQLALK